MSNFFNSDSPIMRVLASLFDDIVYSILTLILCLPIVTIGSAYAALLDMRYRFTNAEETGPKVFFCCFRKHLVKSLISWLLLLFIMALIGLAFWGMSFLSPGIYRIALFSLLLFATAAALFTASFTYPIMISHPELSLPKVWYNAFRYGIGYFPRALLMLLVVIIPALVFAIEPRAFYYIGFIWIFFYPSWICRVDVLMTNKLF